MKAAGALQTALFARLAGDEDLADLVGGAIHDAAPAGLPPPLYLLIGPEDYSFRPDSGGGLGTYDLQIAILGESAGFAAVKAVAAAVTRALQAAPLDVAGLCDLTLLRARTRRREGGSLREMTLIWRALIDEAA